MSSVRVPEPMLPPALTIPASARTLAGFCDWVLSPDYPEHGKITYLNGDLVFDMSPEELNAHSLIRKEISTQLELLIKKQKLGLLFLDRVWLVNEDVDL